MKASKAHKSILNSKSLLTDSIEGFEGPEGGFYSQNGIISKKDILEMLKQELPRRKRLNKKGLDSNPAKKLVIIVKEPKVINPGVKVIYGGFRRIGRGNNKVVKVTQNSAIEGTICENGRIAEFGKENIHFNTVMHTARPIINQDLESLMTNCITNSDPAELVELMEAMNEWRRTATKAELKKILG